MNGCTSEICSKWQLNVRLRYISNRLQSTFTSTKYQLSRSTIQPADPTGQFITDSFGGISGLIASFWDISKQDRNFRNFRTSGYIWLYVQVFIGLNNGSNSNVIIKIQDFSGPLNSKKSWPIPFVNYDHVHNFNRKTWYIKCYLKIYDSDFLYIYH